MTACGGSWISTCESRGRLMKSKHLEETRVRVIDLETAGNGPNAVCEIGWQDVVVGQDGVWRLSDERGALFVNPGRPISAETMAVHHILDSQVVGAPFWKQIGASILQPTGGSKVLAGATEIFEPDAALSEEARRLDPRDWSSGPSSHARCIRHGTSSAGPAECGLPRATLDLEQRTRLASARPGRTQSRQKLGSHQRRSPCRVFG